MGIEERRAREFDRREREILQAALRLFRGDDWENVTVEQIAHHAEVGKGTVYKHFASKDEIYARLALDFHGAVRERVRALSPDLPVCERVRQMLKIGWEAHLSSQELHRVVLYCGRAEFRRALLPATGAEFDAFERDRRDWMLAVIEEGIKQRVFADRSPESLLFGIHAAFWGAVQIVWGGHLENVDREQYLDDLASFILAGLQRTPKSGAPGVCPAELSRDSER